MKRNLNFGLAIGLIALAMLFTFVGITAVKAGTSFTSNNKVGYETYSFLSATTTSATSTDTGNGGGYFVIAGAKHVNLYFSRGDTSGQGNTGSSKFRIQVTPDGATWQDYATLSQNIATSSVTAIVPTVTVPAGTSTVISAMQNLGFYGIRCIVVEATDGEHTCSAAADF